MDLKGRSCSVQPFSTEGIVLPGSIDIGVVARTFQNAIEDELERTGLRVLRAVPSGSVDPDGIVIVGQFTKLTAGNRLKRYFAPFMAGAAAIVEVEGTVTDREIALDEFTAIGRRGLGSMGGASRAMLDSAATIAGRQAARRAIAILAGERALE